MVLLVKPTRLASTILCIAVPTQRIRTIPACTPIASLALMNGKLEKGLENHPGKDDADVVLRSKDFLLISFMSLIIISHISRRPITRVLYFNRHARRASLHILIPVKLTYLNDLGHSFSHYIGQNSSQVIRASSDLSDLLHIPK